MGAITPSLSGNISINRPTTPTIYNVSAPLAATEYSQALTSGTKLFMIRSRNGSKIQFSFVSGETNTKYITIEPWNTYCSPEVNLSSVTIYFETDSAAETVEIMEWT